MASRLGRFLRLFVPIAALVCAVFLGFEHSNYIQARTQAENHLTHSLAIASGRFERDMDLVRSDLEILGKSQALYRYVNSGATRDQYYVAQLFGDFVKSRSFYKQVRLLDWEGKEKLSVQSVGEGTIAYSSKELGVDLNDNLIKRALSLDPKVPFTSRMELKEGDRAGALPAPTIRLAYPIRDWTGDIVGVLDVDYPVSALLMGALKVLQDHSVEGFAVDTHGRFFGRTEDINRDIPVFPRTELLSRALPALWDQVRNPDNDQIILGRRLGDLTTLRPFEHISSDGDVGSIDRDWLLIALSPKVPFSALEMFPSRPVELSILIFVLALIAIGSYRVIVAKELELVALEELKDERQRAEDALVIAESANQAKSRFLACMSHELRTPLNAVIGFSELMSLTLSKIPKTEKQVEYAGLISEGGRSLLALVDDILDLARIENQTFDLSPRSFALKREIENVASSLSIKALGNNVELFVDIPEEEFLLLGDSLRYRQILFNVIGNAIKFSPGGRVNVRITVSPLANSRKVVKVVVEDNGIGILPDALSKIFDPFNRANDSETRRFDGAGLGLSISRNLARLMGGDIHVESTPGAGSTFTVEVVFTEIAKPANETAALESKNETAAPEAETEPTLNFGLSAVAIDDTKSSLSVLQAVLQSMSCETIPIGDVENGDNVVESVRRNKPDLIIVNIHMRSANGIELARRIQSDDALKDLPLVAWTPDIGSKKKLEASAVRWSAQLFKPTTQKDMQVLLQNLFPERPSQMQRADANASAG